MILIDLWYNLVVLHFSKHFIFHLLKYLKQKHKNDHETGNLAHSTKVAERVYLYY